MRTFSTKCALLRSIRVWLAIVIFGLFLSGVTAFPFQHELDLVVRISAHLNLAAHAPAPIRNKWVITWGLINSVGIFFLAGIAGHIRGIPLYWRLIDCSFGVVCGAILLFVRSKIRLLERHFAQPTGRTNAP